MRRNETPWYLLAGIVMVGFVVWLFIQMTRTEETTHTAIMLLGAGALVAATLGLTAALGGRGRTTDDDAPSASPSKDMSRR